ncbi:MAG TPA: hypothetical protein DCL77_12570 [Prolixibacteraceae bacterium]|nr:hypothetical protein [Prolixibacteraceae bacterium]
MKELFIIFLVLSIMVVSAQKHTLFGYIRDAKTGESLIGATLSVNDKGIGTTSNNFGFYSITIPDGKLRVRCSYIGYQTFVKEIELRSQTNLDIELEVKDLKLKEVVITDIRNNKVTNNEMGSQSMNMSAIRQMPAVMGESDLVKSLQLLPGIQATNEGTTNLSVRGGSFDQNLFLLDDAPVYNPSHALGFFSVFNTDAIKSVKVYKASFPAQYGGRLSSIVDIHMKEGNSKELSASGGIGLIASRLTLEGPIAKDKASFILSGRYSYAGLTANGAGLLGQSLGIKGLRDFSAHNEINFYDLNAKVNFKVNDKNHLFLSAYTGSDHFFYYAIDDNSSMDWGNITGTARWNHVFNSKLFSNTMLIYSKYDYSYILKDDARHFKWLANLQEMDVKTDFDYFLNPNNSLKFGISVENHHYFPGKVEPRDATSITKPFTLDKQRAVISTAYLNNEQRISDKIGLDYGLRYSAFFLLGESTVYSYSPEMEKLDSVNYSSGELVKFYQSLEPRFSMRYQLSENSSVKLSWSKTVQFQHLIGNSTVGLPSDVWVPASTYIKPQWANQTAIGYYHMLANNQYEFSIEAYYRKMHHVIDYRDNADLFLNPHVETQVLSGDGHSYGLEFYLEKKVGRMTGWLSYTLSKTDRQIDGINNDQPYSASYDKRHNLSLLLNYKLSPTWSASSIFKFTSGGFATIPEGTFNYYGAAFNYYTNRNGYQLPAYHRLDLSFNYQSRKNEYRKWKTEWNFGIYNVYDRKNIFALFMRLDDQDFRISKGSKMYLYGITPFITFNFKF